MSNLPVIYEQMNILRRICERGRNLFLNKSDSVGVDMFEHMETELGRLRAAIDTALADTASAEGGDGRHG